MKSLKGSKKTWVRINMEQRQQEIEAIYREVIEFFNIIIPIEPIFTIKQLNGLEVIVSEVYGATVAFHLHLNDKTLIIQQLLPYLSRHASTERITEFNRTAKQWTAH